MDLRKSEKIVSEPMAEEAVDQQMTAKIYDFLDGLCCGITQTPGNQPSQCVSSFAPGPVGGGTVI